MKNLIHNRLKIFQKQQKEEVNTPKINYEFVEKHAPWLRILGITQNELATLTSLPYYTKRQKGVYDSGEPYDFPPYKEAEIYYWLNIPKWLYEDTKGRKILKSLDIGASYGTLSLFMKKINPDCQVYIVDFNKVYMSKKLVERYNISYKVNNIELDSFPWDEKYDVIILTEVFEHFNFNPIPTLKKITNLLDKQGKLYFSTPDASEWGRVTKYYQDYKSMPYPNNNSSLIDNHVYQYTKDELMEIFSTCNLNVERMDYAPGYGGGRHFNMVLTHKP